LAQQGVTHLALEASSHGLDQYRLDGLHLTAAAFTNLSHDHLDYHRDMHDYLNAKLMLFRRLLKRGQMAVINADDVYSQQVIEACTQAGLVVFTTGVGGHDLHLHDCDMSDQSTRFCVRYQGQTFSADVPLVGEFMIANLLVAMGLCVAAGVAMTRIVAVLPGLVGAPGRLERVAMLRQAPIYVDYAHKPDALRKVLTTMRHLVRNKLIVVFGCGGDRDRSKRAEMGALAQDLADVVIVTDDNPRSEDPAAIRAAICAAAPAALNIADRAKAIAYALTLATAGDVIVIAGKGHEQGQIIGTRTLPFSDHDVVRALVREMAP
jgi:UDP-N-acetylmuramoyl-L-alanyl-D-glutamate--2,6-diaminopimelate ligase